MLLCIMETDLALLLACMPTVEQCSSGGERRHKHLRREHSTLCSSNTPDLFVFIYSCCSAADLVLLWETLPF